MPLIRIGQDKFPDWCEIDDIKIISVKGKTIIPVSSPFLAFFTAYGNCTIIINDKTFSVLKEENYYLRDKTEIISIESIDCVCVLIQGRWGESIGSSGFFRMDNSLTPRNTGDPVSYKRKTDFDNHFHDFDECWIILEGSGIAVSEGNHYKFSAGDCILTKKGDHHDIPEVKEKIYGIYFETTLKGNMRLGHLWNHTHSNSLKNI